MAAFQKFQFDNFIIDEDNRLQTLPLPEEEPQAEPETVGENYSGGRSYYGNAG